MIATGSGLAPFRAFLQEKAFRLENYPEDFTYGEWNLFFGCCKQNSDYIYNDEIT
jgi:sulfite reductase alpha subunit-like flavoprotein